MVDTWGVTQLKAAYLQAAVAEKNHLEMDVVVHESIESTNTWALQQSKAGKKIPFACFAEQQTQGRGRRGKHWLMLPDSNLAMSLTWVFEVSFQQMHLLPLSIALAIVKTLESFGLEKVQIKWPNDVYVNGKKISGVLIETQAIKVAPADDENDRYRAMAVVIGVGLNYDMSSVSSSRRAGESSDKLSDEQNDELSDELSGLPDLTDIRAEFEQQLKAEYPDRQLVAASLLQNITSVCQGFFQDAAHYLEEFRVRYDFCKNKVIEIILDNNERLEGVALGVNDNAELEVLIDGNRRVFNSADVSVKAGIKKDDVR